MAHEESISLLLDDKLAMPQREPCNFPGEGGGYGFEEVSQTSIVPIESEIEVCASDTQCAVDDPEHSFSDGEPDLEMQRRSCERSSYGSLRVRKRIQRARTCDNPVDVDIECSKDHWSEVSSSPTDDESNREIFERLKRDPKFAELFQVDFSHLKLGEKFAEGGQAEIYEAIDLPERTSMTRYAIKLFKEGISLADLQRQWPLGMLQYSSAGFKAAGALRIEGGIVLDDDRFGFVVPRYWGDLRKLMDMRMALRYGPNQRSMGPFVEADVVNILHRIALGMKGLHAHGIVHRDLKAANVLIFLNDDVFFTSGTLALDKLSSVVSVADYECSWGVLGTGFWRAPEILQQLKSRLSGHCHCTKETDVYSFGMVCYEVVTGFLPFEGHPWSDYDIVLRGSRPWVSPEPPSWAADLIWQCWQHDPSKRPTFDAIEARLKLLKTSQTTGMPPHADAKLKRGPVHWVISIFKLIFYCAMVFRLAQNPVGAFFVILVTFLVLIFLII